jgi:predicted RND superfamily exporter protein
MWVFIARFILRNRFSIIVVIGVLTAFFAYEAQKAELSYEAPNLLPEHDTTAMEYKKFKKRFGQDGAVMVLGISDSSLYTVKNFNAWADLGDRMKNVMGVKAVLSVARLQTLVKNDSLQKFQNIPVDLKRRKRLIV